MRFRQLTQALPVLPAAEDRGSIENQRFATDVAAFELGSPHPGADSFDDQAALQLRDGSDDHHDRSSQWAGGVDLFAEADELSV
jgi:hypothetical protein